MNRDNLTVLRRNKWFQRKITVARTHDRRGFGVRILKFISVICKMYVIVHLKQKITTSFVTHQFTVFNSIEKTRGNSFK